MKVASVLAHAHGEEAVDGVGLAVWGRAQHGRRAVRRHDGQAVAGLHPQRLRQPRAGQHQVAAVVALAEACERAVLDVAGDQRRGLQVLRPHPAHDGAGHLVWPLGQGLGLHHREGLGHAGDGAQAGEQGVAAGAVDGGAGHEGVAVEAQHPADQFGAEAVHHAHDDDEGGDGQQDAGEGDDRDQRHAALAPLGAQVAHGERALPPAEGSGRRSLERGPLHHFVVPLPQRGRIYGVNVESKMLPPWGSCWRSRLRGPPPH